MALSDEFLNQDIDVSIGNADDRTKVGDVLPDWVKSATSNQSTDDDDGREPNNLETVGSVTRDRDGDPLSVDPDEDLVVTNEDDEQVQFEAGSEELQSIVDFADRSKNLTGTEVAAKVASGQFQNVLGNQTGVNSVSGAVDNASDSFQSVFDDVGAESNRSGLIAVAVGIVAVIAVVMNGS